MSAPHGLKAIYDQATGLGDETVQGPYDSEGKIRTFGLQVDAGSIRQFLRWYLQDPTQGSGVSFEFTGDEICLQITYFPTRTGSNATFVWRNVVFLIPVSCSYGGAEEFAFVPVFSFSSNMFGVVSLCEINGCYTRAAQMWSPNDIWTEDLKSRAEKRDVFRLHTRVMPKLVEGGEMVMELLLAVSNAEKRALPLSRLQSRWRGALEKTGANVFYTLKQFPKENDASRSCYQGIVRTEHRPKEDVEMDPQDHSAVIRLYDYPSHRIRATLGLACESATDKHGQPCHELAPTFYTIASGCFREELGRTLAHRATTIGAQNGWIRDY